MPQPDRRDSHVDAILSNAAIRFQNENESYIAHRVFPTLPVRKQSDKYFIYTKEDWFRDEAKRRGDAQESAGSGYTLSNDTYFADVFALHKDIGDQAMANSDPPLDPERDAAMFVTQRLLLRREIQWQSDFFAASVWDTDKTVGTKWSVYTSSDPIGDIETGIETVLENTGLKPNKFVLGYTTFRYLKHHPDLVDRFKYTNANVTAQQMLAQLFGVQDVLVAQAIKNTGVEGETASYDFVQTQLDALLVHATPAPSTTTASAGYTFHWQDVSDGLGLDIGISTFPIRERGKRMIRVEGEIAFDFKATATDLGYRFGTVV